jgi:hypothetical protein
MNPTLQEPMDRAEPAGTGEGEREYGVAIVQRIAHQHRRDSEKPESGERIPLYSPQFLPL